MSLEEILEGKSDWKLGKECVIAAIKLPVPQVNETFWSHKVGCAFVACHRCNSMSSNHIFSFFYVTKAISENKALSGYAAFMAEQAVCEHKQQPVCCCRH